MSWELLRCYMTLLQISYSVRFNEVRADYGVESFLRHGILCRDLCAGVCTLLAPTMMRAKERGGSRRSGYDRYDDEYEYDYRRRGGRSRSSSRSRSPKRSVVYIAAKIVCSVISSMKTVTMLSLIRAGFDTLEARREQLTERFFRRSVLPETSCLHYLLPSKRDVSVTSRLRHARTLELLKCRTVKF